MGINLFGNNDEITVTDNRITGYGTPVAIGPEVGPALVVKNNQESTPTTIESDKAAGVK